MSWRQIATSAISGQVNFNETLKVTLFDLQLIEQFGFDGFGVVCLFVLNYEILILLYTHCKNKN